VVSGPDVVVARVGIACDRARVLDDEVGKAVSQQRAVAARHFGLIRRLDFESCGAFPYGVAIDTGDGGDVRRNRPA